MLNSAKSLVEQFREAQSGASALLEEAVRKGELKAAWEVFQELQELLPKLDWIPSSSTMPLVRDFTNDLEYLQRGSYVGFYDMLCEEAERIVEGVSEEEFFDITGKTRAEVRALMWEIVRKGYAGFTNDW